MGHDEHSSELRSFGRRRGRKLSDRQAALMRDLLPRVAIDISVAFDAPSFLGASVGARGRSARQVAESAPALPSLHGPFAPRSEGRAIWLEIGFGGGEHLVWQAEHNPAATLIGCEPFEDGVVKVLARIEDNKLANIRLHMGDARDVLRWLPAHSIARAFILFPDPWPKRKHRKRRLVNRDTLALLARVMQPGAELRIGTDIGDYARTILQAFSAQSDFHWQVDGPGDWRIRPADWPETRYEQKAGREGRVRYYLRFTRA